MIDRTIALSNGCASPMETSYLHARDEAMHVRRRLQGMVTRLKSRRRSVFFG